MKRIKSSYDIVTQESSVHGESAEEGWLNEIGHDCEPSELDKEDGVTCVDEAVSYLKDEGVMNEGQGDNYRTEGHTDMRTGNTEVRWYFLEGFSDQELDEISNNIK